MKNVLYHWRHGTWLSSLRFIYIGEVYGKNLCVFCSSYTILTCLGHLGWLEHKWKVTQGSQGKCIADCCTSLVLMGLETFFCKKYRQCKCHLNTGTAKHSFYAQMANFQPFCWVSWRSSLRINAQTIKLQCRSPRKHDTKMAWRHFFKWNFKLLFSQI
jgi:hypothetical protein